MPVAISGLHDVAAGLCVYVSDRPRSRVGYKGDVRGTIRVNTDVAPSPMIIIDRVRVTREVIIERGPSEEGPGGAPSGTAHTGTNK